MFMNNVYNKAVDDVVAARANVDYWQEKFNQAATASTEIFCDISAKWEAAWMDLAKKKAKLERLKKTILEFETQHPISGPVEIGFDEGKGIFF